MGADEKGIVWRRVIDEVWNGHTIEDACFLTNQDYERVMFLLRSNEHHKIKSLLLDVSMLASAREEILNAKRDVGCS